MRQALVFLLALAAVSVFAKDPNLPADAHSQPRLHMRTIVGVAPVGDATDVYWKSVNEQVDPVQSLLFRTRFGADGVPQGATTVVAANHHETTSVGSIGATAIAMWKSGTELLASPLAGGRLVYPEGKFIARYPLYPGMTCGTADCLVVWEVAGTRKFAMLDSDANVVAGPFALPSGFSPSTIMLNDQGIFYVRHTINEVRAALIGRDGVVQYDVKITDALPIQFETSPLGIAFDGSHHVLAFLDKGRDDGDIRIVRIAADGTRSQETNILDTDPRGRDLASLSLAWNGETYLLAGSYVFGYPFLLRLDANFAPAAEQPPAATATAYVLRPIGGDFLMGSSSDNRASVFVLKADGQATPPVLLREPMRRRPVR